MNDPTAKRLREAAAAQERGWALTPLKGKVPIANGWQRADKPTREQVLAWARAGNVGLRTGSASGVFVVDIDVSKGGDATALWSRLGIPEPVTPTVITGADGIHYYFQAPSPCPGNSAARLGDHIDTRGERGQVVFVGSIHPDTGRPYRWKDGRSPDDVPLEVLPTAILDALQKKTEPPKTMRVVSGGLDPYVTRAIEEECGEVATASEGSRNDRLNRAAFSLGQLVGGGCLSRVLAENNLMAAAAQCGLPEYEARGTVKSGLDSGEQKPRRPERIVERLADRWEPKPRREEKHDLDLPEECWTEMFDLYRQALRHSTEACDNYHFAVLVTILGCIIGRRAYLPHGRYLFPNFYTCLVGSTGLARKSTAIAFGRDILRDHGEIQTLTTASWEGILDVLSEDERPQKVLMTPGEFRSLATKAKQEGSSNIIPGLTELYDTPPELKHKTRGKDCRAIRPFLSILTASTAEWIQSSILEHDVAGGFLNRWIFVDGTPKPPNPRPQPPTQPQHSRLVSWLLEMDGWLRGVQEDAGFRMDMDAEAEELFVQFYIDYAGRENVAELTGQMAQRRQDTALKIAMVLALAGVSTTIRKAHMRAGIAFALWQKRVIEHTFEGFGQDRQLKVEKRCMAVLDAAAAEGIDGLLYTELHRKVGGRYSSDQLSRAVNALQKTGVLTIKEKAGRKYVKVFKETKREGVSS